MISPGWKPLLCQPLQAKDPAADVVPGCSDLLHSESHFLILQVILNVSCTWKWFSGEVESFVDKSDICGPKAPYCDGEVEKNNRTKQTVSLLHDGPREGLLFHGKFWMLPSPELLGPVSWNGLLPQLHKELTLFSLGHWLGVLMQLLAITLSLGKQSIHDKKLFSKVIKQWFLNYFYTVCKDVDVWFCGTKHNRGQEELIGEFLNWLPFIPQTSKLIIYS